MAQTGEFGLVVAVVGKHLNATRRERHIRTALKVHYLLVADVVLAIDTELRGRRAIKIGAAGQHVATGIDALNAETERSLLHPISSCHHATILLVGASILGTIMKSCGLYTATHLMVIDSLSVDLNGREGGYAVALGKLRTDEDALLTR